VPSSYMRCGLTNNFCSSCAKQDRRNRAKAQKYRQRMVGSLIVTAIVGGALIPPLIGKIADASHSVALAYVVPLVAYLFIVGMHPPGGCKCTAK
jgi:hypothetical protein